MSAASALRPLWLSGIAACKGARSINTDVFLRSGVAHINSEPQDGTFTLFVSNTSRIADFYSHEADRFCSASLESLIAENTRPEFPRSIGWQLIRAYYSAFFALHSLMRLHGWACTRLTKEMSSYLNRSARLFFPQGGKIEAGLYFIKATDKNPELSCTFLGNSNGGTHESLWAHLQTFMAEVTSVSLERSADEEAAQELIDVVARFNSLLSKHGGPSWLTRIRNRINYSHEYGAWHPYESSTCDVSRVASAIERWKLEPNEVITSSTSDELIQYCEACAFVVSLCRTTMKDLVFRSKPNSPFRLSSGRLLEQQSLR